jgi:hypothetical protein
MREGGELEVNLDCPMSSSQKLVQRTGDILWTRALMSEVGVAFPETLAFGYRIQYQYKVPRDARITIINLMSKEQMNSIMQNKVLTFLHGLDQSIHRIVVKPTVRRQNGNSDVSYHSRRDFKSINDAAIRLMQTINPGDGVLVEPFYDLFEENNKMKDFSFCLRANVCRVPNDEPITTTLTCIIGKKNHPINNGNTTPQSLETTLIQWGLEQEREEIIETVRKGSEILLSTIIDKENGLTAVEKGGIGAQTDFVGIDYILSKRSGTYVPLVTKVNLHNSTTNCQVYEFLNDPCLSGESVGPFVETMIERSQKYIMQGKTVLVLSCGRKRQNKDYSC